MQALGAYAYILHEQRNDWYAQHISAGARLLLAQIEDTPLDDLLRPILEGAVEK